MTIPQQYWMWDGCKYSRVTGDGVAVSGPCVVYGISTDTPGQVTVRDGGASGEIVLDPQSSVVQVIGLPGIRFETNVYVDVGTGANVTVFYRDG